LKPNYHCSDGEELPWFLQPFFCSWLYAEPVWPWLAWGGAQVESTPGMVAFTLKSTYPPIAVESMVQQSPKSVISAKPEGHAVARGENPANAGFPLRGRALLPQCSSRYVNCTLF
jgi:hypothetical protein